MNLNQLPNIITSIRLILLIPLSFYLSRQDYQAAVIIFFIAGFSDALDGFLAKRFNWVSRFGSILDPIADKALLVLTMGILTLNDKISLQLFTLVTIRDIYIISGAYYYYKKIGPYNMAPSYISKLNTFVQISLVTLILVSLSYYSVPDLLINSLTIAVYLTVVSSGIHYTVVWGKKYKAALQSKSRAAIHAKSDSSASSGARIDADSDTHSNLNS
ncbi:MAG: CDP-alcohol phosphatidyltransferase family protein [Kangiellaceae bacterium]|nr:CDP-alcohol phosphatidyltransferase family protein [Kangiellaceae bacterium]